MWFSRSKFKFKCISGLFPRIVKISQEMPWKKCEKKRKSFEKSLTSKIHFHSPKKITCELVFRGTSSTKMAKNADFPEKRGKKCDFSRKCQNMFFSLKNAKICEKIFFM